jgi:hypothetical protein
MENRLPLKIELNFSEESELLQFIEDLGLGIDGFPYEVNVDVKGFTVSVFGYSREALAGLMNIQFDDDETDFTDLVVRA